MKRAIEHSFSGVHERLQGESGGPDVGQSDRMQIDVQMDVGPARSSALGLTRPHPTSKLAFVTT